MENIQVAYSNYFGHHCPALAPMFQHGMARLARIHMDIN